MLTYNSSNISEDQINKKNSWNNSDTGDNKDDENDVEENSSKQRFVFRFV